MKNLKVILSAVAFVGAIGTAFATKPMTNRNLWTNSDGSCSRIFCATTNVEGLGACGNTHTKFTNSNCSTQYTGSAFAVSEP